MNFDRSTYHTSPNILFLHAFYGLVRKPRLEIDVYWGEGVLGRCRGGGGALGLGWGFSGGYP